MESKKSMEKKVCKMDRMNCKKICSIYFWQIQMTNQVENQAIQEKEKQKNNNNKNKEIRPLYVYQKNSLTRRKKVEKKTMYTKIIVSIL